MSFTVVAFKTLHQLLGLRPSVYTIVALETRTEDGNDIEMVMDCIAGRISSVYFDLTGTPKMDCLICD